ncbi:hypothetical protein Sinac_4057 [Singulisphaera acidiphila DSM 18658]|uniref:RHS repeat protein n=1 Tax=Singulisphaera acidiphila (strain ATCC BAA-1392 / DSM 18658 / VKM B-2454 / MOB10) TaxID=886293 RepID=L0DHW8_SINAD|nr:hypothetical protein Sinac_4057 [Singulisphaera acidiphila DSM 18658]
MHGTRKIRKNSGGIRSRGQTLTRLSNLSPLGTLISDFRYTYDFAGNKLSVVETWGLELQNAI